jgi:predicted dehydrogenase
VVVSFPLRVSPLCELSRRYIGEGRVGKPIHIHAVNYVPYGACYYESGYRDYSITKGLFLQKATHDFDYMSYLLDSRIVRVAAMASLGQVYGGAKRAGLTCSKCRDAHVCQESPENRRRSGVGSKQDHPCRFGRDIGTPAAGMNEDCSSALLEFANGAHGVYSQVFFARRDAGSRGAIVSGYSGTVSFDWYRNEMKYVRHHEPFTAVEKAGEGLSHFGGDAALADDFLGLVKGTVKEPRTPIQTGLHSVYACLAAKDSVKTGRFITVRQVEERAGRRVD